jgi:hypothetical protein
MEPLDTDLEYMPRERRRRRPSTPQARLSLLFIFPILGVILALIFIFAAVFQWDLSNGVDALVGILLLLFIAFIVMMFWALAPRSSES